MFNRRGTNLLSNSATGASTAPGASSATRSHADRAHASHGTTGGSPTGAQSFIGENLKIEGQEITIRCHGRLDVNGMMHADLHCHELHIGSSGHIVGVIKANSVEIHGRLEGGVAAQHVTLAASAVVEGDIQSQFLSIEPGASFNGRSRKVQDAAQIKPELGPMNGTVETPTALHSEAVAPSTSAPADTASSHAALPLPTPPPAPNGVGTSAAAPETRNQQWPN